MKLYDVILARAQSDRVHLCDIIQLAQEEYQLKDRQEIQILCLDVIKSILDERRLFAGTLSKDGLKLFYWQGSPNEIVGRIKSEWDMRSQPGGELLAVDDFLCLTASDPLLIHNRVPDYRGPVIPS